MSTQGQVVQPVGAGRIGLAPVLFQSITHMAPAAAGRVLDHLRHYLRGRATPLAVVLALCLACLMVAISIGSGRHPPVRPAGLYTLHTPVASSDGRLLRGLGS